MKRFFHASAAILMLVIAYQLGVTAAQGQSGGSLAATSDGGWGSAVVTTSGSVYFSLYGSTNTPAAPHWTFMGTAPVTASAVAIVDAGYNSTATADVLHVFDANGNFYLSTDSGHTWSRRGNVFGSPVPAMRESWGQLKARYQGAPTSAPATPTNR